MAGSRPLLAAAALSLGAFLLVACGGADDNDSGDRPSIDELQAGIVASSGVDEVYALCIADGLQLSTLPNGVIRGVASKGEAEVDEDNVAAYEQILEGIKGTCDTLGFIG